MCEYDAYAPETMYFNDIPGDIDQAFTKTKFADEILNKGVSVVPCEVREALKPGLQVTPERCARVCQKLASPAASQPPGLFVRPPPGLEGYSSVPNASCAVPKRPQPAPEATPGPVSLPADYSPRRRAAACLAEEANIKATQAMQKYRTMGREVLQNLDQTNLLDERKAPVKKNKPHRALMGKAKAPVPVGYVPSWAENMLEMTAAGAAPPLVPR